MKKIEDFLHLYIGCEYSTANSFGEVNATTLPMILKYLPDYKDFKLHLRRLSSMTEEEMNECWFNMPGPVEVKCEYRDGGVKKFDATPEQVHYLLSKGFDLFGLCDAVLAIDAATI
jgi:hypothetical protein